MVLKIKVVRSPQETHARTRHGRVIILFPPYLTAERRTLFRI